MDVNDQLPDVQCDEVKLCELLVVIRPEDKQSVFRLIEGEVGPDFVSYHVLGRGCEGGFLYGQEEPGRWFGWLDRPMPMAFLPKVAIWIVIERGRAMELIGYIGSVIRQTGIPAQYAGGFALLAELGQELLVGFFEAKPIVTQQEAVHLI